MQATITRRFLVTALAVLGTTVLPWLFYGKFLYEDAVKEAAEARTALEAEKLAGAQGDELDAARKRLADAEKKVKAYAYELKLGLDLKGGASITYRVRAPEGQDQAAVLRDAIGVIQRRIDSYGVGEVNIVASGVDQFTVELPGRGKEEIDRIKSVMQKVGSLEFRIVATPEMTSSERMRREREKEKYVPTPGYRWYPGEEEMEYLLEVPDLKAEADAKAAQAEVAAAVAAAKPETEVAALRAKAAEAEKAFEESKGKYRWTGLDLESASYGLRPEGGRSAYEVHFSIVAGRKAAFGDFTGANLDRQMAIVLSNVVHTAPVLQGKLSGAGSIFNDRKPFKPEECQDLVTVLKSGALASTPEEISSFVVGPGLGDDAVRRGRIAVGISFVLVMLFMAFYYKGAGWVANLAVLLNLVMTLGVLMFLGAALSLPGIAGLILTLGMAVDANILVNERIREEKVAGKGLAQAIAAGYDRAWITILDSNLTTILAGVFLYWIGTGPIRGFALTLILGLVISMFTACYVTRTIFLWGLEKGILKEFRMSPVMVIPAYPYTSMKLKTIGVSAALIILGTAAFVLRDRHDKYDLEFNGGERILVSLKKPLGIAEMRDRVEKVVRPGFEKAAAASGEAAKLGAVTVRTVRGPGADAGDLDLSTQSDRFELTAQVEAGGEERSEKAGRIFAAEVEAALAAELAPRAIPTLAIEGEPSKPERPFKAVVNLVGTAVDPAALKAELARVPEIVRAAETKVDKAAASEPGTSSFDVSGTAKAATDVALKDAILRVLRSSAVVEPSDPIPQSDFIGPGVADRLRQQAILAILLSILAQIVYLRFRFRDYTYGFAAAIMVAHNVLITLGAVAVCDAAGIAHVKINLPVIGSFLTLIGYSVNDTIVVFDRIRENLGRSRHPSAALIDNAISQTLARSIRTSITVFFVVLTLFVANYGATSAIEGFGFVMVVGVVTSAYASVFISSPLLLFLPVYSRSLKRLGQPAVLGLIGALFVGLGIAFTQQGATALVGGVFASLLPLHFVWNLFRWLPCKDPDALIREPEEAVAAVA
jgi:SecD/SecF fusion protein